MSGSWRLRGAHGQATVELVAAIPAVLLLGAVAFHALAAFSAGNLAQHAAQAGAIAVQSGADPRVAVTEALPGWPSRRLRIAVEDRRVTVRLSPQALLPALGDVLARSASADAGPDSSDPAVALDWWTVPGGDGRTSGEAGR